MPLSEIQAACQLAHDDEIEFSLLSVLCGKRAAVGKLIKKIGRTEIRIETESLADAEKSGFRTEIRRKLVPRRGGCVSADGTHENRIRGLCRFNCLIRERNAVAVYRAAAHQNIFVFNGVAVFFKNSVEYETGFGDNFGADSVSGNTCNREFHKMPFF